MNTTLTSGLAAFAAATALLTSTTSSAETCTLRVLQGDTAFPMRSQLRGHEGIVFMEVTVDGNGRAAAAELRQSSGHRRLDRAAKQSVIDQWVFDITGCESKDLPANRLVAVEYRNGEY